MFIAEVIIFAPIDRPLSYGIPEELRFAIFPGSLVHVFLGKAQRIGLVVGVREVDGKNFSYTLKPLL
ncbi:MAG: hypothetical protein LBG09_02230, partial [Puniceicoccales bacterium]|nr:hypothetical protein [Puniceicoccales bacterium]